MDWKCHKARDTTKLALVLTSVQFTMKSGEEMIRLYDKNETDFTHNGICILKPLEATVTEELNGDYSLKVTMPRGKKEIKIEQIIKAPTPKSEQLFRVYNSDIDMLGNQVFYARHIFYDLLDYFIEDTRPSGSGALAISKILENTPFTGTSDITEQGTAYYQMMNPVKAILGADNAFTNVWGGELERDNFNVRMRNHLGTDRGVSIRYRKNLTGLRLQTDLSGVYTKIMPTGLQENGQTLLKLPEKYISSPLIDNYVNIKTTRIHYSDIKIDEETTQEQALEMLRNAATQEFENGLDKPQITATVEFIPLQDTEEYKDYSILERVYLGDTIRVFHEDLSIELETKVISYEFDAFSKRYNKVILGNANPKYGDTQKKYVEKQKEETTTALEQAIINATQLITGNQGGYIVMSPSEKPQEIFIMDTPDMTTARKVWRWNLSGLGYSSTGINGPFALAMTMDGAIVADFITTGVLNGALIKAGSVQAGSLSQEYKKSVTDAINSSAKEVTQAFQVADGQVLSTVNNTLSNYSTTTQMNSAITQSANKISSDVSATYLSKTSASNTYATKTSLTQTADSITAEVTRAKNAESALSSSISQNASNITLKVSKGDVSSQISTESDNISISSNRISISSTYFTLSRNGNITCTSADIKGTLETGGTYGYVKLSNGRIAGGYNSNESGYMSFNHKVDNQPGLRIAGNNGIVLSTAKLGVAPYGAIGSSLTYYQGQSASQSFVTKIENNGDGTITWYTRTITFTKGLMTTSL